MRARCLRVAALALIALTACSADDKQAAEPIAQPPLGGTTGGAGGMPMPGMMMMQPEAGTGVPLGGMGGLGGASGGVGGASGASGGMGGASGGMGGASGGMGGMPAQDDAGMPDGGDVMGPDEDACGVIPTSPLVAAMAGDISEYGTLEYRLSPPNELVALHTTMLVPAEPPPQGTVFLWPGIQPLPSSANYAPIGNGVLQPVLTWGPSCAPGAPTGHDSWWISPVYVNISASDFDYRGCHGGPVIETAPERLLDIDMFLEGSEWTQTVRDLDSDEMTEYTLDLQGQGQARAFWVIELPGSAKPTEDIIFTHSVFSMKEPEPEACELLRRGPNDYVSEARVSADGRHCCIDHIALRAEGVPATTDDP